MSTVVISTRVALTDLAFVYRYLESQGIIPKTKSELVRYGMSMCSGGLSRALSLPLLTEDEAYTLLQNTQLFNPEELTIPTFDSNIATCLRKEQVEEEYLVGIDLTEFIQTQKTEEPNLSFLKDK